MFSDIGPLEILTLLVIAIVVLGPDKLPKAISETSALIRKIRSFSDSAQADLRQELGPEFANLHLRDLHPRALAEKALSRAEDETGLREITASLSLDEPADDGDHHPERSLANGTHALRKQPRA
ncbi:Sec-independent protein translocase TatB [Streptomyces sp. NPDC002205]|uniref:Sec-independent protein translocase TatB n=1 Tax=Streptomyces sp. NPDC002205 TaxID=3154411 RepID=UPI003319D4C8